jgi:hypothetical protein
MHATPYEKQIENLVQLHLRDDPNGRRPFSTFAAALRCRNSAAYDEWRVGALRQPPPRYEALLRKTLLHCLQWFVDDTLWMSNDALSILDGLSKQERWRHCLANPDSAYHFAMLVIVVAAVDSEATDTNSMLKRAIDKPVCALLNEWLRPKNAYQSIPSAETLVCAMFGDAWSALTLGGVDPLQAPALILRLRPAFAPGLLPSEVVAVAESLPELECA